MRIWPIRVVATFSLLPIFLVLGGCSSPDPVEWDAVGVSVPTPTPAPTLGATEDKLIVYLDTSASMAGYVSPNGQNVFGGTLRMLRDVATSFKNPLDVSVQNVDAVVKGPDPDGALALQKASVHDIYKGDETDLAGAINSFDPRLEHAAANSESGGTKTPHAPIARFHILITDGVQSKKSQNTKQACLKGSDSTCVREKIIKLLKNGWGGYIIGLRSQFHGKVYSEIKGGSIRYDTTDNDPKRFRPFYLYVFSPERAALDELVGVLRERLRTVAPTEGMRVLALTSPYTDKFATAEIEILPEAEDAIGLRAEQEENPARLTLEVDQDVDEATPSTFTIVIGVPWSAHVLDSGTKDELAKLLRWEVSRIYPATQDNAATAEEMRYPVLKLKGTGESNLDEKGRMRVQATVGWPRTTATPGWGVYRLQGRLDLGMGHEPLAWIRQWSTDLDTTDERADRTLNLESVLTGLWRNPVLEEQVVVDVYLRMGPQ